MCESFINNNQYRFVNKLFKHQTPLHIACHKNNCSMVKLLLKNGADPSIVEKKRRRYTTLHVAAIKGNKKIMKLLIDHGFDLEKLVDAEAIVSLFEYKINFMTVFLILCREGNVECLEYLLSVCAFVKIGAQDFYKRNAIFLSIEFERISMLEYLISKVYDKNRIALELVKMIQQDAVNQCQVLLDTAGRVKLVKYIFFWMLPLSCMLVEYLSFKT